VTWSWTPTAWTAVRSGLVPCVENGFEASNVKVVQAPGFNATVTPFCQHQVLALLLMKMSANDPAGISDGTQTCAVMVPPTMFVTEGGCTPISPSVLELLKVTAKAPAPRYTGAATFEVPVTAWKTVVQFIVPVSNG
jgi:hypothetical protein